MVMHPSASDPEMGWGNGTRIPKHRVHVEETAILQGPLCQAAAEGMSAGTDQAKHLKKHLWAIRTSLQW